LQGFYQVVGLPITVIYDEEGKTIGRINGPIGTPEEFIEYLDKVLKN
jgi:thioredoxin-related protein